MYREKYAQKRAIQLYTAGRPQEVVPMLLEEGASPEQVEQLALQYQHMQRLLTKEDARKQLKAAQLLVTIGLIFVGGGVVLSLLSWLYLDGNYVVYGGILLFGAGLLLKGSLEKQTARKLLQASSI